MTTWILLGGPQHGTTGSGDDAVPAGYDFEGPGRKYSPVYPNGTRESDSVYRWANDTAYIRDGQQVLKNANDGAFRVPAEQAQWVELGLGSAMESLKFGLSQISVEPESEGAQRTRDQIDEYRQNNLV